MRSFGVSNILRNARRGLDIVWWLVAGQFSRAAEGLLPYYRRFIPDRIRQTIPERLRRAVKRRLVRGLAHTPSRAALQQEKTRQSPRRHHHHTNLRVQKEPKNNLVAGVGSNLVKSSGAGYYYGIWMKHLTILQAHDTPDVPSAIVEIGPGTALGVGICAMLSGANSYYALDIVEHVDVSASLDMLEELAEMFRNRRPVKNARGFPGYANYLDESLFPSHILTDERLERCLRQDRIDAIREALLQALTRGRGTAQGDIRVEYVVPWEAQQHHQHLEGNADLIISHSVMEHVDDIGHAYSIFARLCRPGGCMSHQIDFRSHGFTKYWDGYRTIADEEWHRISEASPYTINREPASRHIDLMRINDFQISNLISRMQRSRIKPDVVAKRFSELSPYDMRCSGLFVQAMKW